MAVQQVPTPQMDDHRGHRGQLSGARAHGGQGPPKVGSRQNSLLSATILGAALVALLLVSASYAAPPKMSIFHFDVNTGDATLIVSPDGRGVLIDAGDGGRGLNPIVQFVDTARTDGVLGTLDFTITTHYDADHIGGMDEVLENGWYPEIAVHDRGDLLLPPFDRRYVEESCDHLDADDAEDVAPWGQTSSFCPTNRHASCEIIEYFLAAAAGGSRATLEPGQTIELDHGVALDIIVVNATDAQGNTVDVDFPGRRPDCAANDLSVGVLVRYGDFRYLVAGDLTGVPAEDVADVEGLIIDDLEELDIYHVNHHGSNTSSSAAFMAAIKPTVAIVSNGRMYNHPLKSVVDNRILAIDPAPALYLTNFNHNDDAWNDDPGAIADDDYFEYDGTIEVAVWQGSYRVFRWRNGSPIGSGDRYLIKRR